jgi:hypothetical protein
MSVEPIATQDLTIGICHTAYQIEPVLAERLPHTRVFQVNSTEAIEPLMPEVDVLVVSGSWCDSLLDEATRLKWIQAIGVGYDQFPLDEPDRCPRVAPSGPIGLLDQRSSWLRRRGI